MGRLVQLNTPFPVAGKERITAPFGPVNVSNATVTFVATLVGDSRYSTNCTTSLRPPKRTIFPACHVRLLTDGELRVARKSSCVTLSSPSFAHTAVIELVVWAQIRPLT